MRPVVACLIVLALCAAPLAGAHSLDPAPRPPGTPLRLLDGDPLGLLPGALSRAVLAPSVLAFHDAQFELAGAAPAAPRSTSSVTPDVTDDLSKVAARLGLPYDAGEQAALDHAIAALDPAQRALVSRVAAAYLAALDAPEALSARAHYARLADDPLLTQPLVEGPLIIDDCARGIYIDLSFAGNVHTCDHHLMLDAGGDDTYRNNAGGSIVIGPNVPAAETPIALPALAVDLGGNDRFEGSVQKGGVAGGGHGHAGGLISVSGNDVYDTFAFHGAVNGGGYRGGAGFLVSLSGDDEYRGEVGLGGINGGAGFGGVGLLIDQGGDDVYHGHVRAFGGTNGGANDGAAALVDLGGGNDVYGGHVGGRGGLNAGNEQGVTFLVDDGGDDRFSGHVSGGGVNGGAVGKAAAWFISLGGDNEFRGSIGRMGAVNGGVVGVAVATFLALGGGGDLYNGTANKTGGINGGAVFGQALLFDDGGNDRYEAFVTGSGAANGAGAWGAGRLEDRGGDDVYLATVLLGDSEEFTMQVAGARNGGAHLGTGALIDHGGSDWYGEDGAPPVADETVFPKDGTGMQLDLDGGA